jgi:glucan biosynthesis protein C
MMLLGIYLHVACAYCSLPDVWWFRDGQTSVVFDISLIYIHLFRMPVFMVMAGFFSALLVEKRGVSGFLRNRGLRIGVPLIAGVFILYPILWFLSAYGRSLNHADTLSAAWTSFSSGRWLRHIDTTHLWFLNYLLWLYVLAIAVRWSARPLAQRSGRLVDAVITGWLRFAIWPALTFATLCTMSAGLLDTRNGWIPAPNILAAYAVFYVFGWLLYGRRDTLSGWTRGAWTQVLLALPVSALNIYFAVRQLQARPDRDWFAFFGTALTGAIVVWLMIFGTTGLFIRYFGREHPRWRYLSDSAYWQYILHAPVVLFWQLAVAPLHWSPLLKCSVVTVLSAIVLLVSYDLIARSTWVGVLLNGRRYPRALVFGQAVRPRASAVPQSTGLDPAS